ncbi:MFS transporter (plasmid) [Embleya sp. NBC_00888]|uniref:MFS transporter n=1 Tax=Embleya sp. NBC_00888 TaxID=2975960 RepID=UPI002F9137C4|nr:MFS transporter [Embleya sp. NBC_00888]
MTTASLAPPVRIGKAGIWALGILALATGALESVVTPTLPLLQRELSMTPSDGALLSITLLLTGAIVAPIAGNLGDRYGGKRIMIRLMSVVCIGGLVSSLAPNVPVLLLGQLLQGAMVGALPLAFILVRKHLPAEESKVAIGVISGLFVGGGMVGILAAGPVAEKLSRHWMFALPTIVVIVSTIALGMLMPDDLPGESNDIGLDWPGLVLLSGMLVALMLLLRWSPDFDSRPLLPSAMAVLMAACVIGWIAVERRVTSPMVDLRMLVQPAIWSSYVITFAVCLGTSASLYLVPQLFALSGDGYGFGASATDIGWYLLPGAVTAGLSGPLGGIAARRFGASVAVATGIGVMTTTFVALAVVHSEIWHLIVAKALIALGSGACVTAMVVKTATSVDRDTTGTATSLLLVTRVIGFAVGVQVSGAYLTAGTPSGSDVPAESAFVTGFLIAAAVTALALFFVRTLGKGAKENDPH